MLSLLAFALAMLGERYLVARNAAAQMIAPTDLTVDIRGPGTISALRESRIGSRLQARLVEINVDRNDSVADGQLLARLASDDLAAEFTAARASAEAAERAILSAQADRQRAQAALAQATATHRRQDELHDKGYASEAALDDAVTALHQAEADVARADRTIEQAEAERDAARARIAQARAGLDDTTIRAPIAGVVVSRAHQAGDMLTPGAELLHIVDPSSLVLTTRLDESIIARLAPGQPATINFADTTTPIRGHVARIGREVDQETREFEVDVALDTLPVNWALGQRGTARIEVARRTDVLSVPKAALLHRDGKAGVWIVDDGRARWREVQIGETGAQAVEIRAGVVSGETVLDPDGVYPFMRVRPTAGGGEPDEGRTP